MSRPPFLPSPYRPELSMRFRAILRLMESRRRLRQRLATLVQRGVTGDQDSLVVYPVNRSFCGRGEVHVLNPVTSVALLMKPGVTFGPVDAVAISPGTPVHLVGWRASSYS